MESPIAEPKIRILTGPPQIVERQINDALETYSVILWNISPLVDHIEVTAVLVLQSELRMQQIAHPGPVNHGRR